jgi:hypothetical protein
LKVNGGGYGVVPYFAFAPLDFTPRSCAKFFLARIVSRKGAKQILQGLGKIKLGHDPNMKLVHVQIRKIVIAGRADGSSALTAKRERFRAPGSVRTGTVRAPSTGKPLH